jgi:predicted acetyltransferase
MVLKMEYRYACESDLDLLTEWNHQLIQDEGNWNTMTVPELRTRMRDWLAGEYQATLFELEGNAVAYALFRESPTEIYLRQFFVRRDRRRQGIGREAMRILRQQSWGRHKRLTVDVLTANLPAIAFWRSVGYKDYSVTLEILPEDHAE